MRKGQHGISGLILGLRPVNERRRYKVTPSLIGWAQTWNQPCIYFRWEPGRSLMGSVESRIEAWPVLAASGSVCRTKTNIISSTCTVQLLRISWLFPNLHSHHNLARLWYEWTYEDFIHVTAKPPWLFVQPHQLVVHDGLTPGVISEGDGCTQVKAGVATF